MNNSFVSTVIEVRRTPATAEELLVALRGDSVIVVEEESGRHRLPSGAEWQLEPDCCERVLIGRLDGSDCSLVSLPADLQLPRPLQALELRRARLEFDEAVEVAVCRAKELAFWRRNHRYCGSCGRALEDLRDECARKCPACGAVFYPVISPAIIVAVTDDEGRLLLAHNAKFRGMMHSLIAGFVEPGETLEEAVRREVREEVAIEVKNIRYYGSQSWPYPNSLMAGFTAELASGAPSPDMFEITAAGFYTPADMPEVPPPGSIARELIDRWRNNFSGRK